MYKEIFMYIYIYKYIHIYTISIYIYVWQGPFGTMWQLGLVCTTTIFLASRPTPAT